MDVIEASAAKVRQKGGQDFFTSVTTDSRSVKKRALFIALPGSRFDGHQFVGSAFQKGAIGAVVRKGKRIKTVPGRWVFSVDNTIKALGDIAAHWRNRFNIPVIAVTGSNGKTTTKELIAQLLTAQFTLLKTECNYNNLIGLPWTLFCMTRKHQVAVLEMGMNAPGEIDRLSEIARPHIGVLTNVGRAHLEGLGSIASVARAKGELLMRLPAGGLAVINADDPHVLRLAKRCRTQVLTYGFGSDATIRGSLFKSLGFRGSTFDARLGSSVLKIHLGLPGRYNAVNALAALAIGHHFKIPHKNMLKNLKNIHLPYGRMTQIRLPHGILIINDCYNANPESVRQALSSFAYTKENQRKIAVLGDMLELGKFSERAHDEIGRAATEAGADILLAVGKWAEGIARGARKAGLAASNIHCFETAKRAGQLLKKHLRRNDVILIKGSRGVRLETIVGDLQ